MPTPLANSTFLDWNSYRTNASAPSGGTPVTDFKLNVALILDRAQTPDFLNEDWASRQQKLMELGPTGVAGTYGADPARYAQVLADLAAMNIQTVAQVDSANGYVSSLAARTIWVQVDRTSFETLFGRPLLQGTDQGNSTQFWSGNLSLPDGWTSTLGVRGLWFDSFNFNGVVANPGTGTAVTLPQGAQSLGNSASPNATLFPQQVAQAYNFPFAETPGGGPTKAVGLIEAGIGTAMPGSSSFQAGLDWYRGAAGVAGSATVITVAPGGQTYFSNFGLERSLDVGVVTATNPQSPLIVYAGSGINAGAQYDPMTAYQQAFWDTTNNPQVITSSWSFYAQQPTPGSPFNWAARELFVDSALRNTTVLTANGDGGSSNQVGDGATNTPSSQTSPYDLLVGGTSLSLLSTAAIDPSLASIVTAAAAGNQTVLWQLAAGGLTSLPANSGAGSWQVETVWNQYVLNGARFENGRGYLTNNTVTGGPDPGQPVPSYQQAFGLQPALADGQVGRGTPDVSANAGGNMLYIVPSPTLSEFFYDFGTSAATPLWASLISQINAVFLDQRLPQLGYMNDLLYTAAAIAPASFNDVTMGNNISSYVLGGAIRTDGTDITPTGIGYYAGPGYDLTTGLGSPNGVLLARALTAIAHEQMYFDSVPDVLSPTGFGGWMSGANESLSFQAMAGTGVTLGLNIGASSIGASIGPSAAFAWTSRFAEQVLQSDVDQALVRLFDGQSQAFVTQTNVAVGQNVSVTINGGVAVAAQASLTADFGFADYMTGQGVVRVAQAVMVAETAGGASDQTAIARIRQNGTDNLAVTFFKVDDYTGTIGSLHPGDAGYAAAAQGRAYQLSTGGTSIGGPGYGNFEQAAILNVDAGDLMAQMLTDQTTGHTYWSFAAANEANVVHQWNYGLNVVGWEDMYGGGDYDFNDLVVGIDFTSASGSGWLV